MKNLQLQRIRSLQWICVLFVLSCYIYCEQAQGIRSISPRFETTTGSRGGAMNMHGWPVLHSGTLLESIWGTDSPFFRTRSIARTAVLFNLLAVIAVAFSVCRVIRRVLEHRGSFLQFQLSTLLQTSMAIGALLACWTLGPQPIRGSFDFAQSPPSNYELSKLDQTIRSGHLQLLPAPLAPSEPWVIRLPLIAALGCTFYLIAGYLIATIAELFQDEPTSNSSTAESDSEPEITTE